MFFRPFLPRLSAITAAFIILGATTCPAHEFWIEAQEYQVESGAPMLVDLRTGQNFTGAELPYYPERFQRFDLILGDQTNPVEGRLGDVPAIQLTAPRDGLLVIVHKTTPKTLTYGTWDKFAEFAAHKDFTGIRARHEARGLPEKGFSESYTRYAKALIGVGDARGQDTSTGLVTEFVALTNPYSDGSADGLSVRLFYQGQPRTDAQIEAFERAPDGVVTVTMYRTDSAGLANIPTRAGHTYLLDAVVLREAPEGQEPVWETLWATLTFSVPK